jgi:hypothetical protein
MDSTGFMDNMALMEALWPKFTMEKEVRDIVYEKWQHFHQDKLRDCIRQHRLERDSKPDIAAIHKRYCAISGQDRTTPVMDARRTRREANAIAGPSTAELEAWDHWAEDILATATPEEIATVRERVSLTLSAPRILAVAVDWHRKNPQPRAVP